MNFGRPRGLSLLELLLAMSLFSAILTLTLFFYGQSIKAQRRHDQGSEVYRRAHNLFSDIERFLDSGTLMWATNNQLMLSPYRQVDAIGANRVRQWADQAQVLSISEDGVTLQNGADSKPFAQLQRWEGLSFSPQEFGKFETEHRHDHVTLLYSATPPSPTREGRVYQFQRQILLVRY